MALFGLLLFFFFFSGKTEFQSWIFPLVFQKKSPSCSFFKIFFLHWTKLKAFCLHISFTVALHLSCSFLLFLQQFDYTGVSLWTNYSLLRNKDFVFQRLFMRSVHFGKDMHVHTTHLCTHTHMAKENTDFYILVN